MTSADNNVDMVAVWFDVNVGHEACPDDETEENCRYNELKALLTERERLSRIDEVKLALSFTTMDDLKDRLAHLSNPENKGGKIND